MQDLTVIHTDIRDYFVPQLDGTVLKQKRATFYIGKFGPFVETFDVEGFSMSVVNARVDALKRELQGLTQ